jgi:hypothetical protein
MYKETLIITILLIVIYQIYLNQNETPNNELSQINNELPQIINEPVVVSQQLNTTKPLINKEKNVFVHPLYNKPSHKTELGYIFTNNIPNPWKYIIFNKNKSPNHYFALSLVPLLNSVDKTTILNNIGQWLNFLKTNDHDLTGNNSNELNLIFNGDTLELLIPAQDEEFALTICNLIINTIKGNLSLDNIIKNNLIQVSMNKMSSKNPYYSFVKNKIIEQIVENISNTTNPSSEYKEDLANNISNEQNNESFNDINNDVSNEPSELDAFNTNYNSDNKITSSNSNEFESFEQGGSSGFSFI